jgi:hypothetical protein
MDNRTYYLINHSRNEFDLLSKDFSLYKALKIALKENLGWLETDDIRIGSEDNNSVSCLEYLNDIRYKISKK